MFDAWAPALQGADLAAAAAKMAPLTVHTTVANYEVRRRYRYVPALVNYEELTPTIRRPCRSMKDLSTTRLFCARCEAGGYSGAVAYEMCSPLRGGGGIENLDRCARKFVDFMRSFRQDVAAQGA